MTSALDHMTKILALLNDLNPSALQSKIGEYKRGGLPSRSIPEGSRGSEPGLPGLDATDRRLHDGQIRYQKQIRTALNELESALRFQNSVLIVVEPLPDPPVIPCENNDCPEILEEGRKKGHCVKCRVHKHRWGMQWPWTPDRPANAQAAEVVAAITERYRK